MRSPWQFQLLTLVFLGAWTPALSNSEEPVPLEVVDILLDFEALQGRPVQFDGVLDVTGNSLELTGTRGNIDPIRVDPRELSRDEKHHLFSRCSDGCHVTAVGRPALIEEEKSVVLTRILRPRIKPRKTPKPAASASGAPAPLSVIDFIVDYEQSKDREVVVEGRLVWVSEVEMMILFQSRWNETTLYVDGSRLSYDEKRYLLTDCGSGCSVSIRGVPGEVQTFDGLIALALDRGSQRSGSQWRVSR